MGLVFVAAGFAGDTGKGVTMQFSCQAMLLRNAVETVSSILNEKSYFPILAYIHLRADGKELTVSATDLEQYILYKMR